MSDVFKTSKRLPALKDLVEADRAVNRGGRSFAE